MTEPLDILKINLERDKRIKEMKETDPRRYEREIAEMVNKVRKGYRTLIVNHTSFLYTDAPQSSNSAADRDFRDVAGLLWKTCFYKQIVEFRSSLRKHAAQLDHVGAQLQSARTERDQPSLEELRTREQQERLYVARLTQAFLSFLADSIAFYQKMVSEMEDNARQMLATLEPRAGSSIGAATTSAAKQTRKEVRWVALSVHRCLLYLGDLARYKEMYVDKEPKEFLESLRYYERAALIDPASGNAQNQLAVLATYSDAECVAVYHYCRSILSLNPFSGGFENLALLMAKNAATMRQLRNSPAIGAAGRGLVHPGANSSNKSGKKGAVAPLKHFLARFVHCHGQLFAFASQMHQTYAHSVSSQSQSQSQFDGSAGEVNWARSLNNTNTHSASSQNSSNSNSGNKEEMLTSTDLIEQFNTQLHALLDEFVEQFSANTLTDSLLVRLLAICVFSVHYAVSKGANFLAYTDTSSGTGSGGGSGSSGGGGGNNTSVQNVFTSPEWMRHYLEVSSAQPRSVAESLALQLLYGIISRTSSRVAEMVTGNERGGRAAMNKALPMLSVFADWAQLHAHYGQATPVSLTQAVSLTQDTNTNTKGSSAYAALKQSQNQAHTQAQTQGVGVGAGVGGAVTGGGTGVKRRGPAATRPGLSDVAPPSMFADSQPSSIALPWDELAYLADPALLRAEARARSGMRTAVSALRPLLHSDLRANEHYGSGAGGVGGGGGVGGVGGGVGGGGGGGVGGVRGVGGVGGGLRGKDSKAGPVQFLREHIELRGFLPMASLIETSFKQFDAFSRALNVMSESLSRFHRQTAVLAFIDAAFAPTNTTNTGADGEQDHTQGQGHVRGASSGNNNVQGLLNVTLPPPSASKSKRREGREGREVREVRDGREKTDRPVTDRAVTDRSERPERRSNRAAPHDDDESHLDYDSHLNYDYVAPPVSTSKGPPAVAYAPAPAVVDELAPSAADFPELPKLPRARPTAESVRSPVRAEEEKDGQRGGAMEVEQEEEEEEELDDNVVFKSAFVRSQHVSVEDLLPLHQHHQHNNNPQGQASSQLDALLAQASGTSSASHSALHSAHSSFYLSGPSAPLSSSLLGQGLSLSGVNNPNPNPNLTAERDLYGDLGLGLDLDMDLSKLVQEQEQERQSPLEAGGAALADSLWPPSSSGPGTAASENKLSALFGSDSLLGGDYWSTAPLPALPQPHASFGHAFSNTHSFAGTADSGMSGGGGAGAGGRERSSWTFAQEDPFSAHTAYTAHSAPSMQMHMPMQGQAPPPAYYFPPPQAAPAVSAAPAGLSSLSTAPFGGLFADQGTGTQHSSQQSLHSLQGLGHSQGHSQGQGQSQHSSFGFAQGPGGGGGGGGMGGPSSTAVWSPPGLGGGLLGQTAGASNSASPAGSGPPGLFGSQLSTNNNNGNHQQPQQQQARAPPPRPPGLG